MTRKWRIRLTVALVALGVPVVVASLVVFYSVTGRLGAIMALEYARVMPGHLTVGGVQFTAADQVHLSDVAIAEGLSAPLVTIKSIDAQVDVFNRRLQKLVLHGVSIRFDRDSFDLLQRIINAGDALKPSDPPQEWDLVADGDALFPGGVHLTGLHAEGHIVGALFEISGGGDALVSGGKPFVARVAGRRTGTPAPGVPANRRISVFLDEFSCRLPPSLDAVAGIGLVPEASPGLKQWLPATVDLSGSVVHRDLGVLHFQAPVAARWADAQGRPGLLQAQLDADANRIAVAVERFDDPALGRVIGPAGRTAGTLGIDLNRHTVRFDANAFVPGQGLGLPPSVPVDAVLRQTPRLGLLYAWDEGRTQLDLSGPEQSQSHLRLTWGQGAPLRVEATELPLTLLQSWMPEGVVLGGGQATSAAIVIAHDAGLASAALRDLRLKVDQGRATWAGWSLGPMSGELQLTPQANGEIQIGATVPMGTLTAHGSIAAGSGELRLQAVDALLARLHGPMTLPGMTGSLALDLTWARAADQVLRITVPRMTVARADVRFEGLDLLQGVSTQLKGLVTVSPGTPLQIAARAGGQLSSGQLRLPNGTWLNLAARTPIFTLDTAITPGETPKLAIRELLVRAADAAGQPAADAYSAQLSGAIDSAGNGALAGLVDHADLGWVTNQIRLPAGSATGEGAVTCEALFVKGGMERLSGHFLPLNADVQLGTRFRASGITGAVDFLLDRSTLGEPKP
jgi:hypothetical protein